MQVSNSISSLFNLTTGDSYVIAFVIPTSSPPLQTFLAPVLTLILGKIAAFGMMTHVAAALPSDTALASHQIALSLYFFVGQFLEVFSNMAQTFLPQYHVVNNRNFKVGEQSFARRLLRLGGCVGCGIALIAASIPKFLPFILTNDATVQASVKPLALPLFLASLLSAPLAISEGILLARRELKFLASVYLASTIAFPFGLFKLKTTGGPVSNVWYGFVLFVFLRGLIFTGKVWGYSILGMNGISSENKKEATAENEKATRPSIASTCELAKM